MPSPPVAAMYTPSMACGLSSLRRREHGYRLSIASTLLVFSSFIVMVFIVTTTHRAARGADSPPEPPPARGVYLISVLLRKARARNCCGEVLQSIPRRALAPSATLPPSLRRSGMWLLIASCESLLSSQSLRRMRSTASTTPASASWDRTCSSRPSSSPRAAAFGQ